MTPAGGPLYVEASVDLHTFRPLQRDEVQSMLIGNRGTGVGPETGKPTTTPGLRGGGPISPFST